MQANTAIAGTADAMSPAAVLQHAPSLEKYSDERVRQLEAALENPFDPSEIKWRVTNTTSDTCSVRRGNDCRLGRRRERCVSFLVPAPDRP